MAPDQPAARDRRPEPGLQALAHGGSSVASLFDLDLAELAVRARASAEARIASIPAAPSPPSADPPSAHAGSSIGAPTPVDPGVSARSPGPDARTDAVGGGRPAVPVPPEAAGDGPYDHAAPRLGDAGRGLDLDWGAEDDPSPGAGEDDRPEEDDGGAARTATAAPPESPVASVAGSATAALRTQRARRPRYPRGQLKEKIGILRRVRAMLGVLVLTVVLGIAAGAAIGAFLLFLAFVIRSSITSS